MALASTLGIWVLPFIPVYQRVSLAFSINSNTPTIVGVFTSIIQSLKKIRIRDGLSVAGLLWQGYDGVARIVICGPGGLCDDVGAVVSKHGMFKLEADASRGKDGGRCKLSRIVFFSLETSFLCQ